nr:helix-turn-helix transcriptional regulator [Jiella sp. LLJ827]
MRVRSRRQMLGMSQTALAEQLGVTFQQVQKYEKGSNRISSSRLQQIADALGKPVSFFFDHQPTSAEQALHGDIADLMAFMGSRDGLQLNRAFAAITDPAVRRAVRDLVEALARDSERDQGKT